MIKSVRLVNFFSFGDCTIDLESDLNVLVGINGSGKSNFLRAFQLLKAGMDGRLQEQIAQWGGVSAMYQKKKDKNETGLVRLIFVIADDFEWEWPNVAKGDITYMVSLSHLFSNEYLVYETIKGSDGKIHFSTSSQKSLGLESEVENSRLRDYNKKWLLSGSIMPDEGGLSKIIGLMGDLDIYKQFNTIEDSPMRVAVRATGIDKLLPNGDNVFQVLNGIGLKSTMAYDAVESGLHTVNEHFQRFRMNVYGQGSIEFYLQEKGLETPIHAAQVSDGTLCYLCLLVALHQPGRGNTILFDEPERNLHPDMLFELAKQLEKASEKSQIILTTHAPGLLNQFPLRAVRVFEKDENNQTIIKKFTEEDFAGWYDEFAPGQMWRNGDLGGNRY